MTNATPTLIDLDGFAHRTADTSQAGSGFGGMYDGGGNAAGCTFDTQNKRTTLHVASLKIAQDGVSATSRVRTINTNVLVGSVYFRIDAIPSKTSSMLLFANTGSTCDFVVLITSGKLQAEIGSQVVTTPVSVCDGRWHRLDWYLDATSSTYSLSWQLDGVAQTTVTKTGVTAANFTAARMGSTTAADTLTVRFSDFVLSTTAGDYPIAPHMCLPIYLAGEGTETLGTTNQIQNDSAGQSNLWQKIADWNGGLPDTTGYITYASTTTGDAASNFAEFTLATVPSKYTVWDVKGYLAGFANGTAADNADTQLLSAHGGTLIDHLGNLIDYSGSASALGYLQHLFTRIAGGWTPTNLSACVLQWGRSTDTNAIPRLSAIMLEICIPQLPVEGLGMPLHPVL